MSSSNCCFLTCLQISQEVGQVVWYSYLFQNFPQVVVIHTVKSFGIVSKAEIDFFLELFCFFDNPMNIGNFISGSSAFPKTSLNIWNFTVPVLLKSSLENFEHYLTSLWDECNCAVVWAFFRGYPTLFISFTTRKHNKFSGWWYKKDIPSSSAWGKESNPCEIHLPEASPITKAYFSRGKDLIRA